MTLQIIHTGIFPEVFALVVIIGFAFFLDNNFGVELRKKKQSSINKNHRRFFQINKP